jgi:hypothetical protein
MHANIVTVGDEVFLRGPWRDVISKRQSQLLGTSAGEAVKIEPESVKLKNLHSQKPLPGKGW